MIVFKSARAYAWGYTLVVYNAGDNSFERERERERERGSFTWDPFHYTKFIFMNPRVYKVSCYLKYILLHYIANYN